MKFISNIIIAVKYTYSRGVVLVNNVAGDIKVKFYEEQVECWAWGNRRIGVSGLVEVEKRVGVQLGFY